MTTHADEAYAPLETPDVVPVVSLFFFVVALAARPLVRLIPSEYRPYPWGVLLPIVVGLGAAVLGTAFGLWSLRGGRRRGLSRLALLLNVVVFALYALATSGMVWIFRR
jgi:hypothetical protein